MRDDEPSPAWQQSTRGRDYWLSQCIGFTVHSDTGRVGIVVELRFRSRTDRPDYLIVRAGRLGRRELTIAVSEVTGIAPREKRIRIGPKATP